MVRDNYYDARTQNPARSGCACVYVREKNRRGGLGPTQLQVWRRKTGLCGSQVRSGRDEMDVMDVWDCVKVMDRACPGGSLGCTLVSQRPTSTSSGK
jgi:hypothetical protein